MDEGLVSAFRGLPDQDGKGRPAEGNRTVSPNDIVEAMRIALRTLQPEDIGRREIARRVGVTPARISAHFRDRATLIDAAARPVIPHEQ